MSALSTIPPPSITSKGTSSHWALGHSSRPVAWVATLKSETVSQTLKNRHLLSRGPGLWLTQPLDLKSSQLGQLQGGEATQATAPYSPEGLATLLVDVHLVLQGGGVALAQAVDVKNGNQVVQLVDAGEGHGLPHGALGQLPVAQHAVDTVAVQRWWVRG